MPDGLAGATMSFAGVPLEGVVERLKEKVPEELRRRSQWVVRKAKIPYNARTGARASSTDSETWSTFDEAVRAFEGQGQGSHSQGSYDGVGFVFSSEDPYAGVDLDKCRDPETGEIDDWAAEIVAALGRYAEVSPSGTGVHVIVRGKAMNKKRGDVEAYSSERYFTVTGEALESSPPHDVPISERQTELDALTRKYLTAPEPELSSNSHGRSQGGPPPELPDEEIIELCRKARNAPKFASLFDAGDTSGHDGDDSRADLALLGIFKFYTQDPVQLERLFDLSALADPC